MIFAFPKKALYYSTQGRLHAATGNYSEGIVSLKTALDLEEKNDKESMIRIGEYNYYLLQIKMMVENNNVDKKIENFDSTIQEKIGTFNSTIQEKIGTFNSTFEELKQNLENIKMQYLEYLAFFSSILSFILVTTNIVTKIDDFNKCAGIVIMFAGVLIIVFGVFRMLFYFSSKAEYNNLKKTIFAGILLLIVGFLVGNQLVTQWFVL